MGPAFVDVKKPIIEEMIGFLFYGEEDLVLGILFARRLKVGHELVDLFEAGTDPLHAVAEIIGVLGAKVRTALDLAIDVADVKGSTAFSDLIL